ncbi:MAG TPA: cupin domain-containing protein [Burkholderiaceae bacterium]|jgi:quercetin dioxygenase-like cupin family protein|nr:cupin domain-containing protein [Burkholderiaceae bacterium]
MTYERAKLLSTVAMPLAASAFLAAFAHGAEAPTPTALQVTRVEIQRSDVPGTELETRLYLITYPPGASAPVHHHPVDGLGYILEGSARSAYGSDAPTTIVAGQSFHDLAAVSHTVFVNADSQKPLKFLVAYTVKKGQPVIEIP